MSGLGSRLFTFPARENARSTYQMSLRKILFTISLEKNLSRCGTMESEDVSSPVVCKSGVFFSY